MSETALLAVAIAGAAGLVAGRLWVRGSGAGGSSRPAFRSSPHYTQGLHYLAAGQVNLAISELTKVTHEDPAALEVQLVLGNLLRESGQVERAVGVHQGLTERTDLTRAERVHALACLGMDFQKAGFLDRASRTFDEVLAVDPKNLHALEGLKKLCEEQRQWREAFDIQKRISGLRKSDDRLVLGHLQAKLGEEAAAADKRDVAEAAFHAALALDHRVLPAHLGLAALYEDRDPLRATAFLEEAIEEAPERAYLSFETLERIYAAAGQATRFASLCERLIDAQPRDWRARLALARHLAAGGELDEALGLTLRALEANPQVLAAHVEAWRILRRRGLPATEVERYTREAEQAVFYRDPHVCTACRYRADSMLWRCPHCHEWDTLVEERLGPPVPSR